MFDNGVGFITGAISGVIVIETDGLAGETVLDEFEYEHGPLPETLVIRSGSHRGFHRHFKHPGGKVKTVANDKHQGRHQRRRRLLCLAAEPTQERRALRDRPRRRTGRPAGRLARLYRHEGRRGVGRID